MYYNRGKKSFPVSFSPKKERAEQKIQTLRSLDTLITLQKNTNKKILYNTVEKGTYNVVY